MPAVLKPWHFKWYLLFCVRHVPRIRKWQAFLMGIQCSVGKSGACRKQRERQQQMYFEPLSSALPPIVSVLSQARSSGGRLSKWVAAPASCWVTVVNCSSHIELPCNQQDQAPCEHKVGLLDLKASAKTCWPQTLLGGRIVNIMWTPLAIPWWNESLPEVILLACTSLAMTQAYFQ